MVKLLKTIVAIPFLFAVVQASADNHANTPIGYGISYILEVSDPAAIAAVMTEVRTTDLGKDSPSSVSLNQLVAGGADEATHSIGVFYTSAENIDKSAAMSQERNTGAKVGPVMQEASERVQVVMWTVLRSSAAGGESKVTAENPVSMGYQLEVTDPAAFMAAFDPLWESVSESFPGNVAFGAFVANGSNPATHWVNFSADNMEALLSGVAAMQSSPEMAAYVSKASSFRNVVGESINRRILYFPEN